MSKLQAFPGRIIFDHLPKTAGQAINHWLRSELGTGCVTENLIGKHHDLIERYGGKYSVISGHIEGDGKGLDSRYQYITQLREPIARCISWLYFLLPNTSPDPAVKNLVDSAKRFIADNEVDDLLAGTISNFYVNHFSSISCQEANNDNNKLATAIDTLSEFDVVGLYDAMPNFLADVANIIGITAPASLSKINKSILAECDRQLSPHHYDKLRELNQLDIHFFNDMSSRLKSRKPLESKRSISNWHKHDEIKDANIITSSDIPEVRAQLRSGPNVTQGQLLIIDVDILLLRNLNDIKTVMQVCNDNKHIVFNTDNLECGKNFTNIEPGSHRVTFYLLANLPVGEYTAGFSFYEVQSYQSMQRLALYEDLCKFSICNNPDKLQFNPTEITMHKTDLADDSYLVKEPSGCITTVNEIKVLHPSEISKIGVRVTNHTQQLWIGDVFRPINLSYHWFDLSGNLVLSNELRTPLPSYGISADCTVDLEMSIQAPPDQGQFILELTMVQEFFYWFEQLGFTSCKQQIMVVD